MTTIISRQFSDLIWFVVWTNFPLKNIFLPDFNFVFFLVFLLIFPWNSNIYIFTLFNIFICYSFMTAINVYLCERERQILYLYVCAYVLLFDYIGFFFQFNFSLCVRNKVAAQINRSISFHLIWTLGLFLKWKHFASLILEVLWIRFVFAWKSRKHKIRKSKWKLNLFHSWGFSELNDNFDRIINNRWICLIFFEWFVLNIKCPWFTYCGWCVNTRVCVCVCYCVVMVFLKKMFFFSSFEILNQLTLFFTSMQSAK